MEGEVEEQSEEQIPIAGIGTMVFGKWDAGDLISGISRRDAAQLFARSVDVEDVDFAIVNGISNHRRGRLDMEISRKVLGYAPEDGTVFPRR